MLRHLISATKIVVAVALLASLAGAATTLEPCEVDADCIHSQFFNVCINKYCEHKQVFPQFPLEIAGIFILVTLKILCTMAGVGGGGIVTPLCMVFYGFFTKDAVAVAAFATFAATMGSFATSFKQKHPEKKSTVLIDYGLTCIMMPSTLAGAQIGSFILLVFPTPVVQILLVLMLIALGLQSLRKGIQIRKKENRALVLAAEKEKAKQATEMHKDESKQGVDVVARLEDVPEGMQLEIVKHDNNRLNESRRSNASRAQSAASSQGESRSARKQAGGTHGGSGRNLNQVCVEGLEMKEKPAGESIPIKVDQSESEPSEGQEEAFGDLSDDQSGKKLQKVQAGRYLFILGENEQTDKELQQLIKIVKKEESHFQWEKWLINTILIVVLIFMNLSLPSKSRESPLGITKCSPLYWVIQVGFILFCGLLLFVAVRILKREQDLKIKYGNINIVDSDIVLTRRNLAVLILLGFMGGMIAGALGLGGGVIFNPVLLSMGLPPQVSGACSLYMVFFSKIASCMVYILNDQMNLLYAFWVGLWASVGGIIGSFALILYVKNGGRQSTIVFILVLEFIISISLIPYFGSRQVIAQHEQGIAIWAFSGIC